MSKQIMYVRSGILLILVLLAGTIWLPTISSSAHTDAKANTLTVTFLDVGQGDSIHILTPDGYEMLIDGGPSAGVLRELSKDRDFFDKDIDVVLVTHPDTDHIGGLVDVLEQYQVGMIIQSKVEHDAPAARAFANAVSAEGAEVISAEVGQTIQLGASTTIRILAPYGDTTNWESNTASIVVQVVYGDVEFMLTGDAPSSIEDYLVGTSGSDLESEVLKLGHHGSKTSSSKLFLEAVTPEYAVVSAGKDNRYGHPNGEVIARASAVGAEIIRTAEQGTIVFKTDGEKVWVDK